MPKIRWNYNYSGSNIYYLKGGTDGERATRQSWVDVIFAYFCLNGFGRTCQRPDKRFTELKFESANIAHFKCKCKFIVRKPFGIWTGFSSSENSSYERNSKTILNIFHLQTLRMRCETFAETVCECNFKLRTIDACEIAQVVSSLIFIEWFNISTICKKMHERSKRDACVGDVHKTAQQ